MIFEDTSLIHAEAATVWAFLLDVNSLAGCIPGVQDMRQIDERTFDGTISAAVGPISGEFNFRARIVESDPPREMIAVLDGTDSVTRSTITSDVRMTLAPMAESQTQMAYRADVQIKGRLAILGDMVLRSTATLILEEFMRRLRQQVEGKTLAGGL